MKNIILKKVNELIAEGNIVYFGVYGDVTAYLHFVIELITEESTFNIEGDNFLVSIPYEDVEVEIDDNSMVISRDNRTLVDLLW